MRIVYSEDDQRALEAFVVWVPRLPCLLTRPSFLWFSYPGAVATGRHSLCTCPMNLRDEDGVVDAKLNVYGVCGLKVSDLSVALGNGFANTYGTSLVLGEKASKVSNSLSGLK
ncbi:hypothetical protein EDB85DRAFT_2144633 [Lactarius pseudohatsudake]|nr:hypothetical protein EDB85DRAFT_2144633 [Lactarius pseudohatsudake]